jgi:hypothetical protein
MKCVETTRDEAEVSVGSEVVAAAILVMLILDVFVARIQCFGHVSANCLNIFSFNDGISGTASMTMSTSLRDEMSVDGVRKAWIRSASDWESFSLDTSFDSSFEANASPLSRLACCESTSVTGTEALRAATRAMPRP